MQYGKRTGICYFTNARRRPSSPLLIPQRTKKAEIRTLPENRGTARRRGWGEPQGRTEVPGRLQFLIEERPATFCRIERIPSPCAACAAATGRQSSPRAKLQHPCIKCIATRESRCRRRLQSATSPGRDNFEPLGRVG